MSPPKDLKNVYAGEMMDLWSANDQMSKPAKTMAEKAEIRSRHWQLAKEMTTPLSWRKKAEQSVKAAA